MSTPALLFAVGAALAGAVGAVLQSRGAKAAGAVDGPIRLLLVLVRERIWLGGAVFAAVSGLLHTFALRHGSLIEVESIMVTSLLAALGLGTIIGRSPATSRDWAGAIAVIVGLVVFLVIADPSDGDYRVSATVWVVTAAVVGVVVTALVAVARRSTRANHRAAVFGTAAAMCLGSAAVILKELTDMVARHDPLATMLAFVVALGVVELGALVLQQVAFRAGALGAALAPFVGGNPLVAGAMGIVVFSERFHHSIADLLGSSAGLVLVVVGIGVLASSPAVAAGTGEGVPDPGVGIPAGDH